MALWQGRPTRKITGGRYHALRKKRKAEMGREQTETTLGAKVRKALRVRGGSKKVRLLVAENANVVNPKTGECRKAKILGIVENAANPHFVRRNIVTKGAIINTELGRAKVTSRPGQDGNINAALIEEARAQGSNQ